MELRLLKYGERGFLNARSGMWHAICYNSELFEPAQARTSRFGFRSRLFCGL